MGKQSSRKSHLLTHLSGLLPDVAGVRCTNGVWLAVHFTSDCLYLLLDFEGLGSFECSQDMLLLILNAAFSYITSFNKKASDLTIKLYIIHHLCTIRKILPPPLMRLCASCVLLVPTTEDHSCSKLEQGGLGEGGQKPIDWAPIDTKCIVLKLNLIKEHLSSAILSGCLAGVDVGKELVNLYSQEKVAPDANELIEVDNYNFEISDTSLHLAPQDTQVTYESILQPLREAFQEVMPWEKGKD
ncbi:unnamed protein product [Sphagnum jensenii]